MRIGPFEIRRSAPTLRASGTAFEERSLASTVAAARVPVEKMSAPTLPPKRPDTSLTEIMPPFGTNPPAGTVSGGPANMEDRVIGNDPRELWYLNLPNKLSPRQVLQILRAALGGDIWQQWQLLSLMLDTWPRFRKCSHELREAVSQVRFVVRPYCEDGQEPTTSAAKKADTVRRAMANFRPDQFTDEKGFSGMVYDATDAMLNGLTMIELMWRTVQTSAGPEKLPRAAAWIHPRHYTFTNDGKVALFGNDYNRLYYGPTAYKDVDPRKFLAAQFMSRSGSSLGAGLMRPLAWYWSAVVFNREWMMKAAQVHGSPFVDVTYKSGTQQDELNRLDDEIAKGLANRFIRHVEGTTVNVAPGQRMGADNAQKHLMEAADQACAELLLGQEGTTKTAPGSLGGKDDSKEKVKRERVEGLAGWVGTDFLFNFARAIVLANWGEDSEVPTIVPDFTEATDPLAQAQRDQIFLQAGVPMLAEEFYAQHKLTMPEPGDRVIKGGTLGNMAELQDDVGAPQIPPPVGPDGKAIAPVPAKPGPFARPAAKQVAVSKARFALRHASEDDLRELEVLVLKAKRATHLNGEHAAVEKKLCEIAAKARTS